MKVINLFPSGPKTATPKRPDVHVGPVHFTCPHCGVASEVKFNRMIFRSIEFVCGTCQSFFKLVNPGFVPEPNTKNPTYRK